MQINVFWLACLFFMWWGLIAAFSGVTFVPSLILAVVTTGLCCLMGYVLR